MRKRFYYNILQSVGRQNALVLLTVNVLYHLLDLVALKDVKKTKLVFCKPPTEQKLLSKRKPVHAAKFLVLMQLRKRERR